MAKPENIEELRDGLLEAYEWVRLDPKRSNQVKEMTNAAGKVIHTLKLQLEYSFLRQERPVIEFLGGNRSAEELAQQRLIKQIQQLKSPPSKLNDGPPILETETRATPALAVS